MTTTFTEMNSRQRSDWLHWANSHDWGAGEARFITDPADQCRTVMRVQTVAFHRDGTREVETHLSPDPADLRAWAGY